MSTQSAAEVQDQTSNPLHPAVQAPMQFTQIESGTEMQVEPAPVQPPVQPSVLPPVHESVQFPVQAEGNIVVDDSNSAYSDEMQVNLKPLASIVQPLKLK